MKVAFLANSFHLKKTKSSAFFIELLEKSFGDVTVIPHKEAWAQLPGKKWDLLVVWQKLFSPAELEAFGIERTVLVPMYDDCPKTRDFWLRYKRFRIFCFSRTLLKDLQAWDLDAMGATYFPPTAPRPSPAQDGLGGFFWPRTTQLGWPTVRTLIGSADFRRFTLHWTSDLTPGLSGYPSQEDQRRLGMNVTSWFENAADYEANVRRNQVYFAPRLYEGIGMSFLEAMAWGLCVVAPNLPTMNEYIQDGVNGLLFDPQNPRPLDFGRAVALGEKSRLDCLRGRVEWENTIPGIARFLGKEGIQRERRPLTAAKGISISYLRWWFRLAKRLLRLASGKRSDREPAP